MLATLGAAALCASLIPVTVSAVSAAGASSVASLRQRADALATEVTADYDKLSVLDEGYDQAAQRVQQLDRQVRRAGVVITHETRRLASDESHLRQVAVDAYVDGDAAPGLAVLVSSNSNELPMQQTYLEAASGSIGTAEAAVTNARHSLSLHRATLVKERSSELSTKEKIATERALAEQITAQLESDLASVKGQLAQAVEAAEHEAALQQAAAAQAAALAQQQDVSQQAPPPPAAAPADPVPVQGGGAGSVAVRAAESQLGVPYVWGGATPGVGFDCSGLTMWSWEQAGVSLDHGATEQYYEIAHVSMSELQPGDLIFYGDASYLYHVVMYVGSGPYGTDTVIQAEETGTNVMFTPIPPGAYGAGQP